MYMAKQIKTFSFSRLTLGATSDFHSKVNEKIKAATAAALHIEDLYPAYESLKIDLQDVVNRSTAFVATEGLKEADRTRDHYVGVIYRVVQAHATNPITKKRESAVRLKAGLAPYAGIGAHEYAKQTAEVKGMVAVLKLAENAEAVTALALDEEVAGLEEANAAFEVVFLAKADEASARLPKSDLDSRELCDRIAGQYAAIVQKVNAYAIVQPTDDLEAFVSEVNGLVELYAHIGGGRPSGGGTIPDDGEDSDRPVVPGETEEPDGDGDDDGPVVE